MFLEKEQKPPLRDLGCGKNSSIDCCHVASVFVFEEKSELRGLMSAIVSKSSVQKAGTCPHGLPLGACPICNGMSGGGSVKKDNKPKEMTWNECYAIGQMLKAQKAARKETLQMYARQDINAYLNRLQEQVNALKIMVQNNFPKPIAKVVTTAINTLLLPAVRALTVVINGIKTAMVSIQKTIDNIKQKLTDISDKLASIFGEAKAAIEKKISEKFKDLKKKVFNLFGLSTVDNEEDEEIEKIEETKRLFEMTQTKETLLETKEITDKEDKENKEDEKGNDE